MRNFRHAASKAAAGSTPVLLRAVFASFVLLTAHLSSFGQCTPSAFTVTTNNLVVNTYYPGTTANVPAGGFSIALGASQGAATGIVKGDLVLIIQVQGSAINSNNGTDYGDGVAGGNVAGFTSSSAGTYEYAIAANNVATTGGTLYLTRGVKNAYSNAAATGTAGAYRYQVIRVPRYASLTFNAGRDISPAAWNGTSGGVVAFEVTGTMTVTGMFINASAKGFRGGGGRQLNGTAGLLTTDARSVSTSNGSKGEGIAGSPRYVLTPGTTTIADAGSETYPAGSNGNGAPGNAGGGGTDGKPSTGNDENTGGGGGGNGGAGGRGGKSWNSNLDIGGYGGVAPAFIASSRLIFGGGGGAGSTNDGSGLTPAGVSSSGGAGGGLVLIKVGAVSGTGTIAANGENGLTPNNDGGGGGGAGGTVYITSTTTAGLANITVSAVGGTGGNAYSAQADNGTLSDGNPEHGPGGGGGGGVIYSNAAINAASSAANGVNGTTLTNAQAFGAGPGGTGVKNAAATIISIKANEICDVDDDNDGIPDINEYTGSVDPFDDADSDGIPNIYDTTPGAGVSAFSDSNGDGISDAFDADKDGIMNSLDLDSDNDGIADLTEAGGIDTNGDGTVDNTTDTDGDGLADTYDTSNGGVNIANLDTDGDGIANFKDLDSDNDGYPDITEALGADTDNDGKIDGFTDTDNDGLADTVDGDVGNDGTAENTAGALIITGTDGNADGKPDTYSRANTDRTGLPNPYDLDADGDGILDIREANITDSNSDGVLNSSDTGYTDANGDGWSDQVDALVTFVVVNTDGRGRPNFLDIDSDDDGLTDNVEGQTTPGYILPTGNDTDGDGIDNAYDNNNAVFGGNTNNGIIPNNHDGADNPDYTDSDSDNDGVADLREGSGNASATLTVTTDADGDGLLDQFDTFDLNSLTANLQNNVTISGMGAGGSTTGPSPAGSNLGAPKSNGAATNRDWRNGLVILPVSLTDFSALYQNRSTKLAWNVLNELSFGHYVAERSVDGTSYSSIGAIAARGTGGSYELTDNNLPAVSKLFYRLQLVNANGSFSYSKVIVINLNGKGTEVNVYPNPATDYVMVNFTTAASSAVSIVLRDMSGREVMTKSIKAQAGNNAVQVTGFDQLPAGHYVLELLNGRSRFSQKIIHN